MKNHALAVVVALAALTTLANGAHYYPYEELGDRFQGDLVVKNDPDTGKPSGRLAVRIWAERTVPVVFSGAFSANDEQAIRSAMRSIEDVSCVRFALKEPRHVNYVLITAEHSGCWSALGLQGGAQTLNLDPRGCLAKGAILHQLMHTLGFTHPSNRPDRDLYVQVDLGNVHSFNRHNFDVEVRGDVDDFGLTYDYESIMHRGGLAFSANGRETIIAKHGTTALGQRDTLSPLDIKKLNKMYCVVQRP